MTIFFHMTSACGLLISRPGHPAADSPSMETRQQKKNFVEAATICDNIGQFVTFRCLEPFEHVFTEDGYEVTALLADHNQPEKSLMYLISREGRTLFYAHDTGIFPECTWRFLEGKKSTL